MPRSRRGITLVELVISITVMGILLASIMPLFITTQRGYTAMEVGAVLPAATQSALNKVQHRLVENKRIFDSTMTSFLGRLTPSVYPAAMSGSRLPTIAPNMGLSPDTGTFVAANVGNSLFFASLFGPKDYTVTVNGGGTAPVRIDTFVFNYYYMALNAAMTVGGQGQRVLWEWHSVPYADYKQLMDISDTIKRANAVTALYNDNVRYAYDVTASTAPSAFYTLAAGGTITAEGAHSLQAGTDRNKPAEMIDLIEGVASGGFRYSVSANTGPTFSHGKVVPRYAQADVATGFPSGMEVAVVGTGGARQVFIRLVMAAQGNFRGYKAYENILLVTCRDLY